MSVHLVRCLRKAQNELRLRGFTEQASGSIACDNETEWIIALAGATKESVCPVWHSRAAASKPQLRGGGR